MQDRLASYRPPAWAQDLLEEVEVRVTDEGPRPGTRIEERADHRPGGGILGMRERCHLLGGEFDAGPRAGKGFAVTARLPLAPAG